MARGDALGEHGPAHGRLEHDGAASEVAAQLRLVQLDLHGVALAVEAHDDEVTTSGDGGTNAAAGADMLETESSDSQPSQAGPYLMGSAQKY